MMGWWSKALHRSRHSSPLRTFTICTILRNPSLMDAMFYLDYVKCVYEGTKRIENNMGG